MRPTRESTDHLRASEIAFVSAGVALGLLAGIHLAAPLPGPAPPPSVDWALACDTIPPHSICDPVRLDAPALELLSPVLVVWAAMGTGLALAMIAHRGLTVSHRSPP